MAENPDHRLLELAIEQFGVPEVAARLQVDQSVIGSWRRGEISVPHKVVLALADLIGDLHEP